MDEIFGAMTGPYLRLSPAAYRSSSAYQTTWDTIGYPLPFVDPVAAEAYGTHPKVNIRVFTASTPGIPVRADGVDRALKQFYDYDVADGPVVRFGANGLTDDEQWVTLETPGAIVQGEDVADKSYAFHRCLRGLNLFIQGVMVATRDFHLRSIVAQDLKPAVVIGAIALNDQKWQHLSDMIMLPDFPHRQAMRSKAPFDEEQLNQGLKSVQANAPFTRALLWRGRVDEAMQRTGDAAGAIVGLQTAAESLLFDTYHMLLVDEGMAKQEIEDTLESEPAFCNIGQDLIQGQTRRSMGPDLSEYSDWQYWEKVYMVRNDTVHRGFQPHYGQAEEALSAWIANSLRIWGMNLAAAI